MQIFYTDDFPLPLPAGHRFPAEKYRLLREQVLADRIVEPDWLIVPEAASEAMLELVHERDFVQRAMRGALSRDEVRVLGFPWSAELVQRSLRSVGATVAACSAALESGVSAQLAGGTHHAFAASGEGFCLFNDVAVAARWLQRAGRVERVLVIDCDVHQGNGTAAIFRHDRSVYTFSIHGARNYPLRKQQSDLDVELPDGTDDAAYLTALDSGLGRALVESRGEFAIYLAGADPYVGDRFGRLALTPSGLAARDRMVLDRLVECRMPVAVVMAGGYGRVIAETVAIQAATIREVVAAWHRWAEQRAART